MSKKAFTYIKLIRKSSREFIINNTLVCEPLLLKRHIITPLKSQDKEGWKGTHVGQLPSGWTARTDIIHAAPRLVRAAAVAAYRFRASRIICHELTSARPM